MNTSAGSWVSERPGAGAVLLAAGLDLALGDPADRFHPVKWLGLLIARLELALYERSPGYAGGAALALLTLAATAVPCTALVRAARRLGPRCEGLAGALIVYYCISARSLERAAAGVRRALTEGRLEEARRGVARIVGRETEDLDSPELVRATVESVAENLSDGVVAPLLYAAVFGPVAAALYRGANTLDSMVGYADERYSRFGWVSARLDDSLNYVPARLTAFLLLAAGAVRGWDARDAVRIARRDANKHGSPNAGWPEAAMAGLLGVELGGTNYYGGVAVDAARLGDGGDPLEPARIGEALELTAFAYGFFLAVTVAAASPRRWRR